MIPAVYGQPSYPTLDDHITGWPVVASMGIPVNTDRYACLYAIRNLNNNNRSDNNKLIVYLSHNATYVLYTFCTMPNCLQASFSCCTAITLGYGLWNG